LWHEVELEQIGFEIKDNNEAQNGQKRYFPYIKGGNFRRWSGNFEYIVNWFNDGEELKEFIDPATDRVRSHNYNGDYAFRTGFTWSGISSGTFAVRHVPSGFMFDAKGPMGFARELSEQPIHEAFLNSAVTNHLIKMLAPTLDFKLGHILNLPIIEDVPRGIGQISKSVVRLSFCDWNSYETSWDFTSLPLLNPDYQYPTLQATYQKLRTHWQEMTLEMQRLEEENNRIFIEAYGLQDELTPEVPLSEITLTCNPHYRYGGDKSEEELEALLLADTMKEFISYAVGCKFGRYSLDKEGLVLANQGETLADYVRKVCSGQCVVDSEGENNGYGSQLQGADRLAKGDGFSGAGLSGNETVPEGGTLRADQSGQTISGFHSVQHSGRSGQKVDSGVSEFLVDCERFKSRDGDPNSACPALGLCNERYRSANSGSFKRSESLAERTDEQPEVTTHCPLSTIHFLPDDDNVIPLMDVDWFTDDITERFRNFLRVTFGEEHYEENLAFIEKAIGKDIRKYFLKDFYNDHVKRYKKRPIYWMFSSPRGSFNALIYMHRYNTDTVSVVLNDYLREFRTKLEARLAHLQGVEASVSATQGEKTKALKEIEKIKKILDEIDDYEREILYPLATQRLEIDLDDGVKVNYAKFGAVLKKVAGL